MKVPFKIDHIDPLGQGVSKETVPVTFIPKTLPGEEGITQIIKKSKKVRWGYLSHPNDLTRSSPERVSPECPHFQECSSCHFLHTHYAYELEIKKTVLGRLIDLAKRKRPDLFSDAAPCLKLQAAPQRLQYRNRIQLHYDVKEKKLGYVNPLLNKIVEVPLCLLPQSPIRRALQELYQTEWFHTVLAKNLPLRGHLELYLHSNHSASGSENYSAMEEEVKISWNRPYAAGGFSQVNQEMNGVLRDEIGRVYEESLLSRQISKNEVEIKIIDLFGGNGNLTSSLNQAKVLVVDNFIPFDQLKVHQQGLEQNLYQKWPSLFSFFNKELFDTIDLLILDPPRDGWIHLSSFLEFFRPKQIFYISCNPHSFIRDLLSLKKEDHLKPAYKVHEIILLDMFPTTFHFEIFAHLILE